VTIKKPWDAWYSSLSVVSGRRRTGSFLRKARVASTSVATRAFLHPLRYEDELLPLTRSRNIGVIGMKAIPADYRPRSKLLKLRPALSPMPIVALWRKNAETEALRAFIAAPLAKPTKKEK
jgi:hypothetical protein